MSKLSKRSRSLLRNQNAANPEGVSREAAFVARCHAADKAAWASAASIANGRGELKRNSRASSVLATWVIRTLNRAADKQNPPEVTARRQQAEADRESAESAQKMARLSAI